MAIFNYDQRGLADTIQLGNGGGQVAWVVDHFEITTDGSTPAQIRVPTTPISTNDAASKAYVDSFSLNVQDDGVGVVNTVTQLNFAGPMFDVTTTGAGQAPVTGNRVPMSILTEANASRNAELGDDCNYLVMTNNAPTTYTVQNDATVNFPVGAVLTVEQAGAGQLTIIAGAGVSINSAAQFTARTQFGVIMLVKKAANLWTLTGDLTV